MVLQLILINIKFVLEIENINLLKELVICGFKSIWLRGRILYQEDRNEYFEKDASTIFLNIFLTSYFSAPFALLIYFLSHCQNSAILLSSYIHNYLTFSVGRKFFVFGNKWYILIIINRNFTDIQLVCQIYQKFFFFYETDYFIHNNLKLAKFCDKLNIEGSQKQNLVNHIL